MENSNSNQLKVSKKWLNNLVLKIYYYYVIDSGEVAFSMSWVVYLWKYYYFSKHVQDNDNSLKIWWKCNGSQK